MTNYTFAEDGKLVPVTEPTPDAQVETPTAPQSEVVETQATETVVTETQGTELPLTDNTPVNDTPITTETTPTYSFEKEFQEKTKGKFKSVEEIEALAAEYEKLKSQPKEDFADDFVKSLNDYVKKGGKADTFIEMQKINPTEMSDLQVVAAHLKLVKGIDLTDEQIEGYIIDKYKAVDNPEDLGLASWQVAAGQAELKLDAERFRAELEVLKVKKLEVQSIPQVEQGLTQEQLEIIENRQRILGDLTASADNYNGYEVALNDPEMKVSVKIGTEQTEIAKIKHILEAPEDRIWELFVGENGQIDKTKLYRGLQYLQNPDKYNAVIASNAYSQGKMSVIDSMNNATLDKHKTPNTEPEASFEDKLKDAFASQLIR